MFNGIIIKNRFFIFPALLLIFLFFPLTAFAQENEEKTSVLTEEKIAVLPFYNFSRDPAALKKVMPVLKSKLENKGFALMDGEYLDGIICGEKIKSDSYVTAEITKKIRDEFKVKGIVAGSIVSFSSTGGPRLGIMARLIDTSTGLILWADYVFVSGEDFTTVLGLGRIQDIEALIPKAVDRLLASFSTASFRKERESTYRIAVIPFQNKSKYDEAGMIAMYLFITELFRQNIFEPVEFGDVRKAIVDLRVRRKGEIDYKKMEALSNTTGADTVLVGTVEQYSDEVGEGSMVTITARLLDGRGRKVLWYNTQQLKGEKKIIAFDWDEHIPVEKVAYRAVSLLVKKMKTSLSD